MKKIELKIDGKKTILGGPGEVCLKVMNFVKTLRIADGYYTSDGIGKAIGISSNAVKQHVGKWLEEFKGYELMVPASEAGKTYRIFGSREMIAKLKKELEIV